jgi:hypothetical protein
MRNRTTNNQQSGITAPLRPVAINISIPANLTASTSEVILVDPYTVKIPYNQNLIFGDSMGAHLTSASYAYSQPNICGAGVLKSIPQGNNRLTTVWGGVRANYSVQEGLYSYIDLQYEMNRLAI